MSNSTVPLKEFRLELSDLTYTGHDLVRPESVLAQPDGTLWTSDGRGGVTRINPDGSQQFIGGLGGTHEVRTSWDCWSQLAIYHKSGFWWPRSAYSLSWLASNEHTPNLPITSGWLIHATLEIDGYGDCPLYDVCKEHHGVSGYHASVQKMILEIMLPSAYSLDLFGIRVYPFAQGERRLTTFFPAPLEGTETSFSVTFSCILLYIRSS